MKNPKNRDTRLSASEAISMLEKAIDLRDKRTALELIAPDHPEVLPDWEKEDDAIFRQWDELVERANELLYNGL